MDAGNGTPIGWRVTRLGESFSFTQKPRALRYADYDAVPFVPMDYVPAGYPYFDRFDSRSSANLTSGTYFEPGDLLLAKITPSFENGKQGIIETLPTPFGIATTEVIPIRGIAGVSDTLFLFYFLLRSEVRAELAAKMEGTTGRQRLNKTSVENWTLLLPPLDQQRAVAQALRAVQDAMEARRREVAVERERKAALMQHLFTHGTRGEPRKQTEIGEMPESWESRPLGTIARIAYGLTVNESRRNGTQSAPYLSVANVTRGALRLDEVKQIGMRPGDEQAYRLQKGDVLFVEGSGNPQLLGSAALWSEELPFALHQNHLIRARIDRSVAEPEWVMSYANSDRGRTQLLGQAKTSSGLHNINSKVVASISVPVPDLVEQQTIAGVLRLCDLHVIALQRELGILDELFRATLEDSMTGRLPTQPSASSQTQEAGRAS